MCKLFVSWLERGAYYYNYLMYYLFSQVPRTALSHYFIIVCLYRLSYLIIHFYVANYSNTNWFKIIILFYLQYNGSEVQTGLAEQTLCSMWYP